MKENVEKIVYKEKEYKVVFNLNVMEAIQDEYGTLDKWTDLTSGVNQEVNIKALKFGFTQMLNEALSIEAEEKGEEYKPLTTAFVGRMLTDIGLEEMTRKLQKTIIESTKTDEEKNA
jgi:hypothetical protein